MRTKIDKLESLFKWLLTPTTFLMLVAWNYENYLVEVGLAHPKLMNFQVTEINLLDPSRLLITEITIFGLSIFAFLLTSMKERGKLTTLLRFAAFWGLLFTLTLIWLTFAQAEYPFVLLPMPSGDVSLWLSAVISFALTALLIWHARSEPQLATQ